MILIKVQSSHIKEKFFVAASILYGCAYLFLLWKGALNDVHCNYQTSLSIFLKINFFHLVLSQILNLSVV